MYMHDNDELTTKTGRNNIDDWREKGGKKKRKKTNIRTEYLITKVGTIKIKTQAPVNRLVLLLSSCRLAATPLRRHAASSNKARVLCLILISFCFA